MVDASVIQTDLLLNMQELNVFHCFGFKHYFGPNSTLETNVKDFQEVIKSFNRKQFRRMANKIPDPGITEAKAKFSHIPCKYGKNCPYGTHCYYLH
jgi:hypothetical protein